MRTVRRSRSDVVVTAPSKGWLLPMGITSSCVAENGKMLAFGMDDGTILVWDDHFGARTALATLARAASQWTASLICISS